GSLRAYLSYNYVGYRIGTVITEQRRGLTSLPGYGVLSGRVAASGLHVGDTGSLEVALWGRNLLNRDYVVFAVDNLPQADRAVLWGEPLTVGLDLVYRYF
ncbi:MAG TPA: TonB-dependent receptor, partial [Nevskiaceae bacterium]|nr:TonB-dependent receptor [Nevskiaceae bacterium]